MSMSLEKIIGGIVIFLKAYAIYCAIVIPICIAAFLIYVAIETAREKKGGDEEDE